MNKPKCVKIRRVEKHQKQDKLIKKNISIVSHIF